MKEFTPQYIPIEEIPEKSRGYWKPILANIPEGQALVIDDPEKKNVMSAIRAVIIRTPEFANYKVMQRNKKVFVFHKSGASHQL